MPQSVEEARHPFGASEGRHHDGHRGRHRPIVADPVVPAQAEVRSGSWDAGPVPDVSVVVTTFGRPRLLPGLLGCLEAQTMGHFEVIVVDNGSPDAQTWGCLAEFAAVTPIRFLGVALADNIGAGCGRDRGVEHARAPVLAFTDDDCLPAPGWLAALVPALVGGVAVVQGRVLPAPIAQRAGPWDHSVTVSAPTPFFETANIAYRADALRGHGGFASDDRVIARPGRPAFGEDVLLGARVVHSHPVRAFAHDAVVEHRWMPRTFRAEMARRRDLVDFPRLVGYSDPLRRSRFAGVFLSAATVRGDAAVVGVAAAAVLRRPLLCAAALPWCRGAWRESKQRASGRARIPGLVAQTALLEIAAVGCRVWGSVRHRHLLL